MIGEEGQRILADREFVPTSRKVDTPLHGIPLIFVDPAKMLDEGARWRSLFEEIFLRQPK